METLLTKQQITKGIKGAWLNILLLLIVVVSLSLGEYIPHYIKLIFYSISLTIKSVLLAIIPIIIFFIVLRAFLLKKANITLTFTIILLAIISNFIAFLYGYVVSSAAFQFLHIGSITNVSGGDVLPLWKIYDLRVIPSEISLSAALIFGVLISYYRNEKIIKCAERLYKFSNLIMAKFIIPLVPFFVFGFVLKLQIDGAFHQSIAVYAGILAVFTISQLSYSLLYNYIILNFSLSKTIESIKNATPAIIVSFFALSSIVAMPLTIKAASKNTKNKILSELVISIATNIHTIGTAVGLSAILCATSLMFSGQQFSFYEFTIFAIFASIAKLGGTAIVGGVVLVLSPLFISTLGFSIEMSIFAITLCMMFDPIDSAFNVMCNTTFTSLVHRVRNITKKPQKTHLKPPKNQ